jgi:hypothetical protein
MNVKEEQAAMRESRSKCARDEGAELLAVDRG